METAISTAATIDERHHSPPMNTRTSIVGSFTDAELPEDVRLFLKDGVCIDRRNNTPMEMDAYSVYLGLRAIEATSGRSCKTERELIVNAVVNRLSTCGGFWAHGAWTGSPKEIHMRFTAAAIRLLLEAHLDGMNVSRAQVIGALNRHLEFSERVAHGTWFLHDSLECPDTRIPFHFPTKNNAFGSSLDNCMVLNTHIDTLVTMMHVLRRMDLPQPDRDVVLSLLKSGTEALRSVLRPDHSLLWIAFSRMDSIARSLLFGTFKVHGRISDAVRWLIARKYFALRKRIRARLPGFVFSDGYIERDLSLDGRGFEYHLVNLYDLSRFVSEADESKFIQDKELISRCEALIDAGLNYCILTSYWNYLISATANNTRSILLCEIIVARLRTHNETSAPRHWIDAYCQIRRLLPRTPALLGFDPVILSTPYSTAALEAGKDVIQVREGKLIIDLVSQAFFFQDPEPALEGSAT